MNGSNLARGGSPIRGTFATVPHVRLVPDLITVSHGTTMYASTFKPLNTSLETFITELSKSTERGEKSRRTPKKPKPYKNSQMAALMF